MSWEQAAVLPPLVRPFFQYHSDAYITQAMQFAMETLHEFHLPYVPAIIASGLLLRAVTAPAHVYAEKLFAKQLHTTMYLKREVLKKIANQYQLPIVLDPKTKAPKLGHASDELNVKAEQIINSTIRNYQSGEGLTEVRIRCLKVCTIPLWISASFAVRNVMYSGLTPHLGSFLWIPSFAHPDPYYVLPVICGLLSFLNFYSQRMMFPSDLKASKYVMFTDAFTGFITMFAVAIMCNVPAVMPAFWATVSLTGLIQSLLLRHPKVKDFFGIKRLPWDTRTPFRDLIFLRRIQTTSP